uniref:Major facilitator superfamily (MFS) profile domain-containing protein n=1 Tax=Graphocephala atropunctata TaxID=36148 RepID=A0A1B6M7R8_9HEMI
MGVQVKEKLKEVNFEEAMEIAGWGKFSIFMILLSGLTMCVTMLGAMDVAYLLPSAQCDLDLSSRRKGLLGSAYFIGTITAAHLSGFLADTLGRKFILIRGTSLNVMVYILGSLAPNFWIFFVLKIFSGVLTAPTLTAVYPLLGELVPRQRGAQAVMVAMSLTALSMLYSSMIGWLILGGKWAVDLYLLTFTPWRLFYLLCCLPSLLVTILLLFTPESPKFLLAKNNNENALKVLQKIYSYNTGNEAEDYPVLSVTMDADEVSMDPPKETAGMLRHILDQTLPLFKYPHLKNTALCTALSFVFFLCHDTMLLWLPEITNRVAHYEDTPGALACTCEMVQSVATPQSAPNTSTSCQAIVQEGVFIPNLILGVTHPAAMLAASLLVCIVDRKLIIAILLALSSAVVLMVTLVTTSLPIILLLTAFPVLVSVCSNMCASITIEIFPTYIRAMAVALMIIAGRLGSICGSQLFSLLLDSHCLLLFHLLSFLLICWAALPFGFRLKS